jgi:hypothetical protein
LRCWPRGFVSRHRIIYPASEKIMNETASLESAVPTSCLPTQKKVPRGQRGRSGPPGNKNAVKHGLYVYKAMLDGGGLDQRTSLFKALREKEQELVTALGGDPSPQEQAIISDSVKNMLYIASLDNYLMQLKSLVRKGRPHPVLDMRTKLAAHLRENLKALGLQRRVKRIGLVDLLAGEQEASDSASIQQ